MVDVEMMYHRRLGRYGPGLSMPASGLEKL